MEFEGVGLGNAQLIMAENYDSFALLGSHIYTDINWNVFGVLFSKKRIPELALDIGKSLLRLMVAPNALCSKGSNVYEEQDSAIQFGEMAKKKVKEVEANALKVGNENSLLRG